MGHDRADRPLLDREQAQDLRLELAGDHRATPFSRWRSGPSPPSWSSPVATSGRR
jgi:hypothetical protein